MFKRRMSFLLERHVAPAHTPYTGGYGTLEEGIEILTWAQLGFHKKPVALLNIDGFYDQLLGFFDHCVTQARAPQPLASLCARAATSRPVLAGLAAPTWMHI